MTVPFYPYIRLNKKLLKKVKYRGFIAQSIKYQSIWSIKKTANYFCPYTQNVFKTFEICIVVFFH